MRFRFLWPGRDSPPRSYATPETAENYKGSFLFQLLGQLPTKLELAVARPPSGVCCNQTERNLSALLLADFPLCSWCVVTPSLPWTGEPQSRNSFQFVK